MDLNVVRPVAYAAALGLLLGGGGCTRGSGDSEPTPEQKQQRQLQQSTPARTPATSPAAASATQVGASRSVQDEEDSSQNHERLYGTWVATDVNAPMGEVKIQLTFKEEGPVKILAWSELPLVGQVRNKSAPYEIRDSTLQSDAIRDGTSVKYWFNEQGQLVIEYEDGKAVTFRRP